MIAGQAAWLTAYVIELLRSFFSSYRQACQAWLRDYEIMPLAR